MKKIVIIFLLISLSQLFAENHISIKYGINSSVFYNDNNSSFSKGYCLGLNYEYFFLRTYFVDIGLYYFRVSSWLRNKILLNENYGTLWRIDVKAGAGYLKIPLNVGFIFPLKKNLKMKLYTGYIFLKPILDYTKEYDKYTIKENIQPNEAIKYDFRYVGDGESIFPNGNYSYSAINIGSGFIYGNFCLDLNLDLQLGDFGKFDNISKIEKSLLTIEILFGFRF